MTALQMACSRETAKEVSRETLGGAHKAANHGKTTAEFPPTRETVLAPGWRANLKAKWQKVLPDRLQCNEGHQSKDRFNIEATWGALLIDHLWVSHIPPT